MTLTNSAAAGNSASFSGSGIGNEGRLTLKSTLLAGNTGSATCSFASGPVTSLGWNLSDDGWCALSGLGDENNVVAGAGLDRKGPQNNGGPTQTVALVSGSPAVDHIPVADCTDASGKPLSTDQRGVARPQGPTCEVGAYELVEATPFASFHPSLAINDGKHPGFILCERLDTS